MSYDVVAMDARQIDLVRRDLAQRQQDDPHCWDRQRFYAGDVADLLAAYDAAHTAGVAEGLRRAADTLIDLAVAEEAAAAQYKAGGAEARRRECAVVADALRLRARHLVDLANAADADARDGAEGGE